ncbi:MAG: hypothetical protein LW804_07885 [Cryomorphaceae bacterium]|jgi:hypothetical protein|nr:hypothetical protein [Cryomorphaceae bacterium]
MQHESNENFSELIEEYQEEFETPGELHRMAAYHLMQASRQHELAAEAFENDDQITCDLHSLRAYKHELNGRQYSEMAMMDADDIDDIEDPEAIKA